MEQSNSQRARSSPEGLLVRARACPSCIYRKNSPHDIEALEAEVRDRHGFFTRYRMCHHHDADEENRVCCRGFWNRHKDTCDVTQIAQRLKLVKFVE